MRLALPVHSTLLTLIYKYIHTLWLREEFVSLLKHSEKKVRMMSINV